MNNSNIFDESQCPCVKAPTIFSLHHMTENSNSVGHYHTDGLQLLSSKAPILRAGLSVF